MFRKSADLDDREPLRNVDDLEDSDFNVSRRSSSSQNSSFSLLTLCLYRFLILAAFVFAGIATLLALTRGWVNQNYRNDNFFNTPVVTKFAVVLTAEQNTPTSMVEDTLRTLHSCKFFGGAVVVWRNLHHTPTDKIHRLATHIIPSTAVSTASPIVPLPLSPLFQDSNIPAVLLLHSAAQDLSCGDVDTAFEIWATAASSIATNATTQTLGPLVGFSPRLISRSKTDKQTIYDSSDAVFVSSSFNALHTHGLFTHRDLINDFTKNYHTTETNKLSQVMNTHPKCIDIAFNFFASAKTHKQPIWVHGRVFHPTRSQPQDNSEERLECVAQLMEYFGGGIPLVRASGRVRPVLGSFFTF